MGGRGHLPLALSALLLAGCVDFAEPRLPNAGAPALLQLSISLQESGVLMVNGQLQPGRDSSGVTRVPRDSAVYVAGQVIEADTVLARNTLPFSATLPVPQAVLTGPITIAGPAITGILAPSPLLLWYGMEKIGSDTVFVEPGGDAVLRVNAHLGQPTPAVQVRQWYLTFSGPAGTIQVSGSGFPPDTLRVPPQFLPGTPPATILASLIYYQSAQVREPPGDYIVNVSMDARTQWVVRLQ